MADPVTNNKSLLLMATGTASGQWGADLNASVFTPLDTALGSTVTAVVSSSDVDLTNSQVQNLAVNVTGTLSANVNITLPLSPNSTTNAVGGYFIFNNNATGAYGVTVKTVASGSVGVAIPQGVRSILYSNGVDVAFADDAQNQTPVYNGNPNGNLAGKAGSVATRASRVIDYTTNTEYLCTTSGTASSAVWSANLPYSFPAQGYLTANSDATNPVLTSDSLGASTIYYTAFRGDNVFLYNGVSFAPVAIPNGQASLALSSSFQGANGIYDVLGFLSSTSVFRIAFSPAWPTATAGSGSRGTGAGTPQLSRLNGILVNAVAQTVNNGANSFSVDANKGTYLGSVYIDSTAGQVTCHRSYGQSRKFGVWNAYNRLPITLIGGDPTSTWNYSSSTWRPSNNNSANSLTVFSGLPEEQAFVEFSQYLSGSQSDAIKLGIGVNTTSSPSQLTSPMGIGSGNNTGNTDRTVYTQVPFLGINIMYALESIPNSTTPTLHGTSSYMMEIARWNG